MDERKRNYRMLWFPLCVSVPGLVKLRQLIHVAYAQMQHQNPNETGRNQFLLSH